MRKSGDAKDAEAVNKINVAYRARLDALKAKAKEHPKTVESVAGGSNAGNQ